MLRNSIVLLFIATSFTLSCLAQTRASSRVEAQLKACLDSTENQTTYGMCNCNFVALDRYDKLLNADYKVLLSKLNKAGKAKLIESQRQWVKFKQAEIAFLGERYGNMDGTMWRIVLADKETEFTRNRLLALEEYLIDFDEH